MHFGENQLSRSLIGLSPLPTAHPPGFQPRWVRSSTRSYTRLNLAMGRSPRFGSAPHDSHAHLGLALATATPTRVNLATQHDSQAHSSIGTPPPHQHPKKGGGEALTARRRPVSGTLSLPSRGTFHHSLTVLIRYRSPGSIQAAKWSWQTHTGFHEPRATTGTRHTPPARFRLQGSHPLRPAVPDGSATQPAQRPPPRRQQETGTPQQPRHRNPRRVSHDNGLAIIRFRSPLLTEYPLLRVLRCFTSPRNPPHPIQFRCR